MRRKRIKKSTGKDFVKAVYENYETVKCAFCNGRGIDPFPVLSPISNCPVCHGRGAVRVKKPYSNCPACGGTGIYTRSHLYCWTCRGKGVVYASPAPTVGAVEGK